MPVIAILSRQLQRALLVMAALMLSLISWLVPLAQPALADSGLNRDPAALETFLEELRTLQGSVEPLSSTDAARLHDLEQLAVAIGEGEDPATVQNSTTHNLGLLARYKKDPPAQPAAFYVLAPGHGTDDDFDAVALLIPSQVSVTWDGAESPLLASAVRVLPLLPGEELEVSDSAAADETTPGYQLNLPALGLQDSLAGVSALPALSQQALDAEPETAPLD